MNAVVAARERRAEFAVLRALGAGSRQIFGMLVTEQAFVVGLSLVSGTALAVVVGNLVVPHIVLTGQASAVTPGVLFQVPWAATVAMLALVAGGAAVDRGRAGAASAARADAGGAMRARVKGRLAVLGFRTHGGATGRLAVLGVRTHPGTTALLAVLTAVACLLVAGLPRLTQASFDEALRRSLATADAVQTDLTVSGQPVTLDGDLHERARFEAGDRHWRGLLPAALRPLIRPDGHVSAKTVRTPVTGTRGTFVNLGWLSDAGRRVDWIQGREPGEPSTTGHGGRDHPADRGGRRGRGRPRHGPADRPDQSDRRKTPTPRCGSSASSGRRTPATAPGTTTPTSCTSPTSCRWKARRSSTPRR
ncbi:ABC transporter permease [Nonomuraea ferruginea]